MQFPDKVTRLCGKRRFTFGCNPKVACFTDCCRELELMLTPYDVLCLCRELQMSATEFIGRFAVVEEDENGGFPRLYLGMADDGKASCPFISEKGCRVYNSRPGACRAYPVGRGATLDVKGRLHEIHILVREEHCLGFKEPDSHTVAEWFENQGLNDYNAFNDKVLSLLQHGQMQQSVCFTRKQKENFMLALYKLDEFRDIVSAAAFQKTYLLSHEEWEAILEDDLSLLRFGIDWLKKLLFTAKI